MALFESYESPRNRRLRSDLIAMVKLRDESSVVVYEETGAPPQRYTVEFRGKGLAKRGNRIEVVSSHKVDVKLGASYPRTKPDLRWMTPIYHPNISELGMVCLGGFDQHWAPSLTLDVLCEMLWDMVRYQNYDVRSPYNRDAAVWANDQNAFRFPLDTRPIRDLRVAQGRIESPSSSSPSSLASKPAVNLQKPDEGVLFVPNEPIAAAPATHVAPVVAQPPQDILFID